MKDHPKTVFYLFLFLSLPLFFPPELLEEVAQSCPTLSDPVYCSLPGSSVHGVFQARVLEWGAIAFSGWGLWSVTNPSVPVLQAKVETPRFNLLCFGFKNNPTLYSSEKVSLWIGN